MCKDTQHLNRMTKAELLSEVQFLRSNPNPNLEPHPAPQADFSDTKKNHQYVNQETELNELIDAVECMNAGFILYDANGRFIRCNSLHKNYYPHLKNVYLPGIERIAALQQHAEHLAKTIPDFDIDAYLAYREKYRGIPRPEEERLLADGRWVSIREHMTSSGGLVTVRTDITDLKDSEARQLESEEHFRVAFQSSHGIATITDVDTGKYIDVNDAWLKQSGFKKHEVIGKTSIELNIWGSNEHRQEVIADLNFHGKLVNYEIYAKTKTGKTVEAFINAEVVNVQGRNLLFITGSDVTERNQLEKQLRRSQKMKAVGQLTGGIAHDFNNILGILLGNLEIIQKLPPGDSRISDRIDIAKKSIKRGADITRKLLGFSRKDPHEVMLVDLNVSVNNLIALLTKSLTVSIDVKTILENDLWSVEIDPGDFEDAILNLALNAKDAMPDGGVLIIKTENKILDEELVRHNSLVGAGKFSLISIRDTGTGMTDKVKDRVFDPFFTTKEVGQGTGLGLSMVYGFVERSGGFITIDSDVGNGTVFNLFIPSVISNEVVLIEPETTTDFLPRGCEKILIVDDEGGLRDIAAVNLTELGYKILIAEDGPSALMMLEQNPDVDLMFSDVVMPHKMDGYELAQTALKLSPKLKVLLTSGYSKKRSAIKISNDEILIKLSRNLLSKPYTISEMITAIRNVLDEKL